MMGRRRQRDPKVEALRKHGTLNPRADEVREPAFLDSDFLDARDLLQVKYEMLRRVRLDGRPVADTADLFGVSRPTFYKAQAGYDRDGLAGLLPVKRGPRGPHKLTDEVMEFIVRQRSQDEQLGAGELARRVQERFGMTLHPRTVERGLARMKKKPR